ncbi:hypothetical protein MK280_00360, partial [Myxococcota bacterium]|nr:hypothetical protein [Myxococcota bacterium]
TGEIIDGAKHFRLRVRVLDDSVQEIPALEYAWFDPEQDAYQTTRSRPIALSVRPADIVSAADVIRPSGSKASTEQPSGRSTPSSSAPVSPSVPLPLANADLSIDLDIDHLARRDQKGSEHVPVLLYGFGTLLVAAAFLRRKGRLWRNHEKVRRTHYHQQRTVIESCAQDPPKEALQKIAAALRGLAADSPAVSHPELNAFLRECDEILYAPNASTTIDVSTQIRRALELTEAIMRDSE